MTSTPLPACVALRVWTSWLVLRLLIALLSELLRNFHTALTFLKYPSTYALNILVNVPENYVSFAFLSMSPIFICGLPRLVFVVSLFTYGMTTIPMRCKLSNFLFSSMLIFNTSPTKTRTCYPHIFQPVEIIKSFASFPARFTFLMLEYAVQV